MQNCDSVHLRAKELCDAPAAVPKCEKLLHARRLSWERSQQMCSRATTGSSTRHEFTLRSMENTICEVVLLCCWLLYLEWAGMPQARISAMIHACKKARTHTNAHADAKHLDKQTSLCMQSAQSHISSSLSGTLRTRSTLSHHVQES